MAYLTLHDEKNSSINLLDIQAIQIDDEYSASYMKIWHQIIVSWSNGGQIKLNYHDADQRDIDHEKILFLLDSERFN